MKKLKDATNDEKEAYYNDLAPEKRAKYEDLEGEL